MAQVVDGGGTNSLTVITVSLGTYVAGGTINTGTLVTWGEAASVTNNVQPTIAQGAHNTGSVGPMIITFGTAPTIGDWIYALIAVAASTSLNTPVGWTQLGSATTSTGLADITVYLLQHQMNSGDSASFTFTSVSGTVIVGWLADISGTAGLLTQFTIADATAQGNGVLTAPITPYLPNSLVLGMVGIRNGSYTSTRTGWTEVVDIHNPGGTDLGIVSGPPTTTNPILANITQSDYCVAAMLILPPVLGGGSRLGSRSSTPSLAPLFRLLAVRISEFPRLRSKSKSSIWGSSRSRAQASA